MWGTGVGEEVFGGRGIRKRGRGGRLEGKVIGGRERRLRRGSRGEGALGEGGGT